MHADQNLSWTYHLRALCQPANGSLQSHLHLTDKTNIYGIRNAHKLNFPDEFKLDLGQLMYKTEALYLPPPCLRLLIRKPFNKETAYSYSMQQGKRCGLTLDISN